MSEVGRLLGRPFPIIFAAPSGAGKTTIAQRLRERRDDVVFSISATTRDPRSYEHDGVDYHFVGEPEFRRMAGSGELLEWAEVHTRLYGTPRRNVEEAAAAGKHLILDIDVQGSRLVRRAIPEAVAIFVLPPSGQELVRRLVGRGSEDPSRRRRRLAAARREIEAAAEFDYVIVNDDLDSSVAAVESIIDAERRRSARLRGLPGFVEQLCREVDEAVANG
ncbi:MAG TPA: guanylate kinase [Longimicrobiaceae bacterium]|nr:guanylate kinase [Longimicrobiaceae bacterium]